MNEEYGIRWTEVARDGRLVTKYKFFSTAAERDRFTLRLERRDNFVEVTGAHNLTPDALFTEIKNERTN